MNSRRLIVITSIFAVVFYFSALAYIGFWITDPGNKHHVEGFPSYVVTAMSAALATHCGAAIRVGNVGKLEFALIASYILSLAACVFMWGYFAGFDTDPKWLPAIQHLATTFPGVLAGFVSVRSQA